MNGDRPRPSALSALARLGWMLAGNGAALIVAATIMQQPRWTLGARDVIFWLVVTGVVALRYLDVTRLGGLTADGRPATVRDVSTFGAAVAGAATLVWTIAQSLPVE